MDVRTELYNTNNNTTTKDYLSAGLTKLPSLYYNFSNIYVCVVGFWIFICFKNHQSLHWIHLLIGVLLVVKGLNLFFGAEVQHYLNATGTRPYRLDVLFYIFQFLRVVLLYPVIVIAATRKKKVLILMVVIPLQVLAIVVSVKGENNNLYTDSVNRIAALILINFICFSAFIYLTLCVDPYETYHDQASRNFSEKFTPFCDYFYAVGVAYMLIDLILGVVVSCSDHWASNATNEIASLGFFMIMLYMFMPFDPKREEEYSGMRKENSYQFEL